MGNCTKRKSLVHETIVLDGGQSKRNSRPSPIITTKPEKAKIYVRVIRDDGVAVFSSKSRATRRSAAVTPVIDIFVDYSRNSFVG